MEAVAKARFQRISPRKARVVLNMVRGKNVAEALNELRFTAKSAAPIVAKVIGSAIANARQKDEEKLVLTSRRFRPRARAKHAR